ncbi:MAG: flagellar basal body-associated FliL family protein [Dongiaceae bacterium]
MTAAKEEKKEEKEEKEEGEEKPAGDDAEGGKKKKLDAKKLVLFIVLPVFLLAAAGGGGYYFFVAKKSGEEAAEGGEHAEEARPNENAVFFDVPDIIVNLSNASGKRNTFLKLSVSLEVESQADVAVLEKLSPRIVDKFQVYLRGLQVEDLQGNAGVYRLREELLERVQLAVKPVKVHGVYFKELLIQ